MRLYKLENFTKGWWLGDFEPSVLRNSFFEVGLKVHKKGDEWPAHYQETAVEYNLLVDGRMTMNDQLLMPGDIFEIAPREVAKPTFLEDCIVVVVKVPSLPGDKKEVTNESTHSV